MSRGRTLVVVALVVLLALDLAAVNGVVAAERSVLDPSFVKTSLEEEGAYGTAHTFVVNATAQQMDPEASSGLPISAEAVVAEAVTADYVERQSETNIDRVYPYLHGKRDELEVAVNLTPVKENTAKAVGEELRQLEPSEILAATTTADGLTVDLDVARFDLSILTTLADNRTAYRTAKRSFRHDLRERLLSRAVDRAFAASTNDELLALVVDGYDPSVHTAAEKASMVAAREVAIRRELRGRVEGTADDQLDERVEDQLGRIREDVATHTEDQLVEAGVDPRLATPAAAVVSVSVEGLTTDQPYDQFRTDLDRAQARLAANASAMVKEELSKEVPDRVELSEMMGPDAEQGFEQARRVVGLLDLLALVLPLLALLLVGLLWYVSRSPLVVALGTGLASLAVGLTGAGGAAMASAQLDAALSSADVPSNLLAVGQGFVERTLAVVTTQSLGLAGLGIGLVGASVAGRVVGERERPDRASLRNGETGR